ncbi:g-patch domain protein [Oesophagostomum dentatum]|uniref:G patch domain-containing protein 11 n=1 Tax=Oesophagostomum dentatum TaxID=61180 RepID=A0A0B1T3Z4_OESDE|nr:g-patch domain protein [Oesophagostomum dentatum]
MEEEDDYMSDNFLAMTQDVKPGIATSVEHRRILKIESERARSRQQDTVKPRKRELEKVLREEALSKPVPETSKGFSLLAKMGYKPGMSLGKKKDGRVVILRTLADYLPLFVTDYYQALLPPVLISEKDLGSGIKEPIPLEVKVTRTGLGHDSERENQSKQRLLREMERMKRRAEQTVELIDDYRKRKRGLSNTKDLIRDILASRKVCVELDMRMDIEFPEQSWFWKSYKQPNNEDETTGERLNSVIAADDDDNSRKYVYANGKQAPQEERFDELADEELNERLTQITCYLRSTHRYCIWCGCQFEGQEELESYCPGFDRQAHDSIDE